MLTNFAGPIEFPWYFVLAGFLLMAAIPAVIIFLIGATAKKVRKRNPNYVEKPVKRKSFWQAFRFWLIFSFFLVLTLFALLIGLWPEVS